MPKMTYIIELVMDNFNNLPLQREEIAVSDRNVAITVAKALKNLETSHLFLYHICHTRLERSTKTTLIIPRLTLEQRRYT